MFWPQAIRGPQGPQGAPGPENLDFYMFLAVLGAGRNLRSFPEHVGTILAKYQPKRTHPDLFQSIFYIFMHFHCIFQLILPRKFAIVSPQNRLIT